MPAGEQSPSARRLLIVACTGDGMSRAARALRAHGCRVEVAPIADVAERLRAAPLELLVVERDQHDTEAVPLLRRLRSDGCIAKAVLVSPADAAVLLPAVNQGRIARFVDAGQDAGLVAREVIEAMNDRTPESEELHGLRGRCRALEEKIDGLVREGLHRDSADRLLNDLLVEIGHASGVKEIAGRCLARVVTLLRLDMALMVLDARKSGHAWEYFSFGCPRSLLDDLREISWPDVLCSIGGEERPRPVESLLREPLAARLSTTMALEGVRGLTVYPLRAGTSDLGALLLGARERRSSQRERWDDLSPVAKQIAIAVQNSQLLEAASNAEAMATGVLQHLPCTVVICDARGRVARCFDARQSIFGGRLRERALLDELLPPDAAQILREQITRVSHGCDPICLRALRLQVTHERLVHVSIAALPGRQVLVIFEDVTSNESLAGDLRHARALTSSLFANTHSGVVFLRHNGDIIDINQSACSILRGERAALLGKSLGELSPDLWRAVSAEPNGGRGEITFAVADGEHAVVSFSSTRLGRRGGPAGLLLQVQDMGEVAALREELRRKDNLALMGQMVSFVAHEIKNPLFGISSAAQVLARECNGEEANRLSTAMLSEIDGLGQLLEELLVFGSRRAYDPVAVDPTEVCQDVAAVQAAALAQRGLRLELALTPPKGVVLFDPGRLRQVVVNLFTNAVDATPDGGTIALKGENRGTDYTVAVENTGRPIPAEDRERIFDLFYSTKPRGNGLGLPICRKIADDHGARITVSSATGERTAFTLHIPMSQRG